MAYTTPLTLKSQEKQEHSFCYLATIITQAPPAIFISKAYTRQSDGSLHKETGGKLKRGTWEAVRINSAQAFADMLTTLDHNTAITYGLPKLFLRKESSKGVIVSSALHGKLTHYDKLPASTILRTRSHFDWHNGQLGEFGSIMMIDYDPQQGQKLLTADEFMSVLIDAVPAIASAPAVVSHSTSTFIYDSATGEQLVGEGGKRVYLFVRNGADIPRFASILADRLWLNGHGFCAVDRAGKIRERLPIDTSVYQPERFDYTSAFCGEGLEQKRPAPVVINADALPLDISTKAIRGVNNKQRHAINERKGYEASKLYGERQRVIKERESAGTKHPYSGIEGSRYLPSDFIIQISGNKTLTVQEITERPSAFAGIYTRDPLEPDYAGGRDGVAYISHNPRTDELTIYSHAHGGQVYNLPDSTKAREIKTARLAYSLKMARQFGEPLDTAAMMASEVGKKIEQTRGYAAETGLFAIVQSAMGYGVCNAKEVYDILESIPDGHVAGDLWRESKTWSKELSDSFWFRLFFKSLDTVHAFGSVNNPDISSMTAQTAPAFMTTNKNNKEKTV